MNLENTALNIENEQQHFLDLGGGDFRDSAKRAVKVCFHCDPKTDIREGNYLKVISANYGRRL